MYEYVHRFRSNSLFKEYAIPHDSYGRLIEKRQRMAGIKPMLDFEMLDVDPDGAVEFVNEQDKGFE
jgi:hypothetical protein